MATKLKSSINKYFSQVWLIEIIIAIVFIIYSIMNNIKGKNNNYSNVLSYLWKTIRGYLQRDNTVTSLDLIGVTLGTIIILISIFICIKIILLLIINKGKIKISGNFIKSFIYVFKNGFKYYQTKKVIMMVIIFSIMFFILYLYLLAVGGYESNVLVNFFSMYPFKGSIVIMLFPTVGLLYSIKKTIEISMINEKLRNLDSDKINYSMIEDGSKEIIELVKLINNLRNNYENAVEETLRNERLKTELISNVSHDLRTPLTSIINYVNILQSEGVTEEERKEYLEILEHKSKKLKALIDDLFEMSKINSGKIRINKEKIDIMSLLHQSIGEYSFMYEDKEIEFIVNSEKEQIFINLDGKMMSRAIENVLINALKYSLNKTRIYINANIITDTVCLSFKNVANYEMSFDNDEIFERFERGDKARNSKIEGSGLGLAITKSIVELHGGIVKIKREGDMFKLYMYLPYEKEMDN